MLKAYTAITTLLAWLGLHGGPSLTVVRSM